MHILLFVSSPSENENPLEIITVERCSPGGNDEGWRFVAVGRKVAL